MVAPSRHSQVASSLMLTSPEATCWTSIFAPSSCCSRGNGWSRIGSIQDLVCRTQSADPDQERSAPTTLLQLAGQISECFFNCEFAILSCFSALNQRGAEATQPHSMERIKSSMFMLVASARYGCPRADLFLFGPISKPPRLPEGPGNRSSERSRASQTCADRSGYPVLGTCSRHPSSVCHG